MLQAISPFPTMCSTQSDICIPICPYIYIIHVSLFSAEFEKPKIDISGKGLTEFSNFLQYLKMASF